GMSPENIPEPQSNIESKRRGLNAEFGLINSVKWITDAGIQRYAVVISKTVAEFCSEETAQVQGPVRRIRATGLSCFSQLVTLPFNSVLKEKIGGHPCIQLQTKGLVDQEVTRLHRNTDISHAVVDTI